MDDSRPTAAQAEVDVSGGTFRVYRHLVIGLAIALIAPFTGFAWPFAVLTGIVVGKDEVERRRGVPRSIATKVGRILAVTGGVLAMLVFGAIVGGLIAMLIVALAALSERAAADAEPLDRVVARMLLLVIPAIAYVALIALGGNLSIRVGS